MLNKYSIKIMIVLAETVYEIFVVFYDKSLLYSQLFSPQYALCNTNALQYKL